MKLKSFKCLLKKNPHLRGKVQFIQIVIPSRISVPEYKDLKLKIEQLVSSINGEFGTPSYIPVNYIYHSVSNFELSALYQLSEVLHVGSKRDGMNLVCLEYVVSQTDEYPGCVLLSEFTGAASTLSHAISINPWDIQGTAEKINLTLDKSKEINLKNLQSMKKFLRNYTSSHWAESFLADLNKPQAKSLAAEVSSNGIFPWLSEIKEKKILFLCDLDGTLIPIVNRPEEAKLNMKTKKIISELAKRHQIVIISGRDKDFLSKCFTKNKFPVSLAACHGAYSFCPVKSQWSDFSALDNLSWKEGVLNILNLYVERTPGSFIEDKGPAITWHYRNATKGFSDFMANKLFSELEEALSSVSAEVIKGKKVIEVRSIYVNKGIFAKNYINSLALHERPDVIIALGDDITDEDLFKSLQEINIPSYCVKIGTEKTIAQYLLQEQNLIEPFFNEVLKFK